jgi:DNA-binding CsgD family transcriptional regulator
MLAIASTVLRQPSRLENELSWLPPHIAQRDTFSGQLSALERVGRGALVVDVHARVWDLNGCIRFGDGLQISGGLLQAAHSSDRPRLQRFLSGIIVHDKQPTLTPTTLTLPRPSGLRPWLLNRIDYNCTTALLLVTDVEQPSRVSPGLLAQVFGLTSTEAKLAIELASGRSLCDVSAHLGISEGHARQRLKTIFCKTSTSRQGELIALLAKLG